MATANFFTPDYETDLQAQNIARQRKLADILRERSQEPVNGQMVSGHYVAPSITQYLSQLLQGSNAGAMDRNADESTRALGEQVKKRNQGETEQFIKLLRGTPAVAPQPEVTGNNPSAYMPAQAGQEGVAPDRNAALIAALGSSSPGLQGVGAKMVESDFKVDSPFAKIDPKDFTPESIRAFAQGGAKDYQTLVPVRKLDNINGVATNMYQQPSGAILPQDPNALVNFGMGGTPQINPLALAAKQSVAHAGASNINVAAPENEYNKEIGKGLATSGLALVDAAKSAPEVVRNAQMIRSVIANGAITGSGADARLAVQKALETAGLVGQGKAANTQALMSGLGKISMAGVKTSGLGAGNGFTDKDLAFIQSAISGTIDSTPENLLHVADLSERIAKANYEKGSKVLQRWQTNPALGSVAQDSFIDPLPPSVQAGPPRNGPLPIEDMPPNIQTIVKQYKAR